MRIEQRIGRIDRRGQKSEAVSIYNMITAETLDADIYYRCLARIGVFESSIGECSEILGDITKGIQNIIFDSALTEDERKLKLETMSDNEIRKIQELRKLDDEGKQLFGIDTSEFGFSNDVQNAENLWISPNSIQSMVTKYLQHLLGPGDYITGEKPLKTLRLAVEARTLLLDDYRKISLPRNQINRTWEKYLKSNKANCYITFDSIMASQKREAFFITTGHPLVKQAVKYFSLSETLSIGVSTLSDTIKAGKYPFSIYSWNYVGFKDQRKIVVVCEDKNAQNELMELLQTAQQNELTSSNYESQWRALEQKHLLFWNSAKKEQKLDAEASYKYKSESLISNFNTRKRILQEQISAAQEEHILRMKQSELLNAENVFNTKMDNLKKDIELADIHIKLLVNGVLTVKDGDK